MKSLLYYIVVIDFCLQLIIWWSLYTCKYAVWEYSFVYDDSGVYFKLKLFSA